MQRPTPRLVPLVAAATFVLGACGSAGDEALPPPDGETPDSTAAAALIAPTPIEVTGSAAAGGEVAAAAAEGADTGEIAMLPVATNVDYVVGDQLAVLPTDDTGYLFDGSDAPTVEEVAALAAAFGVDGDVVEEGDGGERTWRVGPDDGTAGTLWVYGDALSGWNYNGPWADRPVAECVTTSAIPVDPDAVEPDEPTETDVVVPDCPEPEPPAGVPSADEAERLAADVLAAIGVDTSAIEFETFADEWFASVTAYDSQSPLGRAETWSFGYGADGVLEYASGSLAEPVAVGPYPLVDLDAALARLSDGGSWFGPAVSGPAIAVGEPSGDGTVPDTVSVTLVDVVADLWWVWDADGAAWLLPAYRFVDSEGGVHVVPAVTDELLVEAETDEPLPVPDPAVADLVGLPLDEFQRRAEELGHVVRVVEIDGEPLAVTEEFLDDRINVAVVTLDGVETVVRATTDAGDVVAEIPVGPTDGSASAGKPPVGIVGAFDGP
jgi:hypothetical protein